MNSTSDNIRITIAQSPEAFEEGKSLFQQYAHAINIDLSFQSFEEELATISTKYNHPSGALLLAYDGNTPIACVGVRRLDAQTAELKRMYVHPAYRGHQLGRQLLVKALEAAKGLGYAAIRLDTLSFMQSAIKLYQSFGFTPIAPYYYNPMENVLYMEKRI